MKYVKLILSVIVILQIAMLFAGCVPDQYEPEEGIWYCDELQIQLSYESYAQCYIIEDDEKILCACGSDRGVKYIHVTCLERNHPQYKLGDVIFFAEVISLNDTELLVYDEQTEQQYVFLRIE